MHPGPALIACTCSILGGVLTCIRSIVAFLGRYVRACVHRRLGTIIEGIHTSIAVKHLIMPVLLNSKKLSFSFSPQKSLPAPLQILGTDHIVCNVQYLCNGRVGHHFRHPENLVCQCRGAIVPVRVVCGPVSIGPACRSQSAHSFLLPLLVQLVEVRVMEIEDRICCCVSRGLGQKPFSAAHLLEQSPHWPSTCCSSVSIRARPATVRPGYSPRHQCRCALQCAGNPRNTALHLQIRPSHNTR